jgi:hypothetical protein
MARIVIFSLHMLLVVFNGMRFLCLEISSDLVDAVYVTPEQIVKPKKFEC